MTPAINLAKKHKITYQIHQYQHDPKVASYGLEAAEKLGCDVNQVYKTLIVELDKSQLAVAVVPVNKQLNLKLVAKAAGAKKAEMAQPDAAQRATGYLLGGVSPLGQKKRLKSYICQSAEQHQTLFVSAGKRGLEIELQPQDLQQLTQATFARLTD